MAGVALVSGEEAAAILGISFDRFKVAIYRGLGKDHTRKARGSEPQPVSGGWSNRQAKYRAKDIRRMHAEYHFRTSRNFPPDYKWLRALPKAEYNPVRAVAATRHAPPAPTKTKRKPPTPTATPTTRLPMAARGKPTKVPGKPVVAPKKGGTKSAPVAKAVAPKRGFKRVEVQTAPFKVVEVLDLFSLSESLRRK